MAAFFLYCPLLFALSVPCSAQELDSPGNEAPSRRLLRELTQQPRLAGTTGSRWGAVLVERELLRAGWEVEIDAREVLLSLPRRIALSAYEPGLGDEPLFRRTERFEPDAHPPGDVPPCNAWSASGVVFAPVIDAGHALRTDFEELLAAGVQVEGSIALARYGGSYRGVKARLAEEYGCAALLLFNDPAADGAQRAAREAQGAGQDPARTAHLGLWPWGPWKPDWDVERGSIAPMTIAPGDPSTPGWPSPAPGEEGSRLTSEECDAALPGILCTPIPAREALALLERLAAVTFTGGEGQTAQRKLGPGPVHVQLDLWQPRELRTIYNVIGRLRGSEPGLVLAGNHRDAWVRGAHDAGGGTVALLRAAQRLGQRARLGWRPRHTLALCFWDAEEPGLIGSTEWAEAHAEFLRRECLLYVNADALVGGTEFRGAAGTPGLLGTLRVVLEGLPATDDSGSLWDSWVAAAGEGGPQLGLPGSGSDYTVFLHHLGLPILDLGLSGSAGGQYHTTFDGFRQVDRHLDPTWRGHELGGQLVASLLTEFDARGAEAFSEGEAARRLAEVARASASWLGEPRALALAAAFETLADAPTLAGRAPFYQRLEAPVGLPGRQWFRNRLWAPGLETGYSAETFPSLRFAQLIGDEALDFELHSLMTAILRGLPQD
jgi:N-acetylated-alpha-linked acidic dipeptidase